MPFAPTFQLILVTPKSNLSHSHLFKGGFLNQANLPSNQLTFITLAPFPGERAEKQNGKSTSVIGSVEGQFVSLEKGVVVTVQAIVSEKITFR
jgi:hypothetical protein